MKRMLAAALCALCALLPACAAAPEEAPPAPEETAQKQTPGPIDLPAALEDDAQAVELYKEYLSGQRPAKKVQVRETELGREVSIVPTTFQPPDVFDVYENAYGAEDPEEQIDMIWRVESFSLFDLDGDGTRELILYTSNGAVGMPEVLSCYNGEVYVNSPVDRGFRDLRTDGTFDGASGASTLSLSYARFSGGVMERLPYFPGWEDTDPGDGRLTVNGQSVSDQTLTVWYGMQDGKPFVQWHDWSPSALDAAFTAEKEARALYREVLDGRRSAEAHAIGYEEHIGESRVLAPNLYSNTFGRELYLSHFAVMDLDGDGVSELVLALRRSENGKWEDDFVVFTCYGGKVVASELGLRSFADLRADGTFGFAGGIGYSGDARAHFENGVLVTDEFLRQDEFIRSYMVNGDFYREAITWEEYEAAEEIQDAKPEAPWQDVTEENFAAELGTGRKLSDEELAATRVTYLPSRWGDLLASCVMDNFQMLPEYVQYEHSPEYADLRRRVPQPEDVRQYDPGENASTPQGRSAALTVASNGDWEMFPNRAVRTTYSLDDQPQRPDWTEYFAQRLEEDVKNRRDVETVETPVIIREVLTFTWNGVKAEVVTASNVFITASEQKERGAAVTPAIRAAARFPSENSTAIYRYTAIFFKGRDPIELTAYQTEIIPWCQWMAYPEKPEDAELVSLFSAVETGENGKLGVYPVFCDREAERKLRQWSYVPRLLLCDVDGDRRSELVVAQDGSSNRVCSTFIYRLGSYQTILMRTFTGK